jgi:flagellar biosynthesis/type III secretory pathway protein FliH
MGYRDRIEEVLKTVNCDTGSSVWQQALLDLAQLVDDEASYAFDDGLAEGRDDAQEDLDTEYQDGYDAGYDEGFEEGLQTE